MTTNRTVFASAIGVAVLGMLSGCGGGGETPVTAQSDPSAYYNTVLSPNYNAQRIALNGDVNTGQAPLANTTYPGAPHGMPTSGSATYNGYMLVNANRDGSTAGSPRLSMEGTASVNANFTAATITGSATNFVGGVVTPDPTNVEHPFKFVNSPVNYTGTLAITGGCIGVSASCAAVTRPNQFEANVAGTLTGEGNTVTTNTNILGDFRGSPIQGVWAANVQAANTINGAPVLGSMFLVAKP